MSQAFGALQWRFDAACDRGLMQAAAVRRRFLRRVAFIGVTGSAGKTMAKELIVAILARELRGRGNNSNANSPIDVAKMVWTTPFSSDFCVMEMSASRPGYLDKPLAISRPRIGVVTTVGDDHLSAFGSREAIAQEKGKLIGALPSNGTAVLNADDALVAAMAPHCAGRVLTYGLSHLAEVRAEEISANWPRRLELTVTYRGEHVRVLTQLCGKHWTPSVLAAVATGVALGISLQQCAEAIAATPPYLARMQPISTGDGIVFIRDDWKAPLWTIGPAFEFMREAQARRKIIVIGTLSDYRGDASGQYLGVARRALEIAEHVVFVGPWAHRSLRAADGRNDRSIRAFSHVRQSSDYLISVFQQGDLILLKGTNRRDHLFRIILARSREIRCWRDDCDKTMFCDRCELRLVPSGPPAADLDMAHTPQVDQPAVQEKQTSPAAALEVIIGLGNPGADRVGSPHNIGHAVLDRLAETLESSWFQHDNAMIGRAQWKDRNVCLVKLQTGVNKSGAALRMLA
ncbi:MAG: Mur ligase family protein, partial [Burkholderiales bacterium]